MGYKMPCRDVAALMPLAQQACMLFLEECQKAGVKVLVTQTLRSAEYQNQLYQQGRTTSGNIVTNADGYKNKSNHQGGMAWDICKNVKGQEYSDKAFFKKCGDIANKLGIEWGGSWKFVDEPHFQIDKNWKPPQPTYTVSKVKVDLFGKIIIVDAINVDDTNHIKLRDLVCSKIKVEYKSGVVYVNGKMFKVDGIMYQGNNYVKVRCLEQAGFCVTWDYAKKIIVIR